MEASISATTTSNTNQSKLVDEFAYLLERSQQLFAGLRDIAPTASQRQWQPYFQKTFEVYTKLWKFQQQHRTVLENKELYGLKRWEIGEIASKISQLYYHYYLRTCETNYLYESLIFYEAIRERDYFGHVSETKTAGLVVKKLRYYARFLVVCLLLGDKQELLMELKLELSNLVDEYVKTFKGSEADEWTKVLEEIDGFIQAENSIIPLDIYTGLRFKVNRRITKNEIIDSNSSIKIQEAILVGNSFNQTKFSELTVDMYRMLLCLENETSLLVKPNQKGDSIKKSRDHAKKRFNIHKYLLYNCNIAQLLMYINTAFKDLEEGAALLLYLSARGCPMVHFPEASTGYNNGLRLSTAQDSEDIDNVKASKCLFTGDLISYTRKPMLIIIDSEGSPAISSLPMIFKQPIVCLLSPTIYPNGCPDSDKEGSLFTNFIHSPLLAFSQLHKVGKLEQSHFAQLSDRVLSLLKTIREIFLKDTELNENYKTFLQCQHGSLIICRFVFFYYIIENFVDSNNQKYLPSCYPPLPEKLLDSLSIKDELRTLIEDYSKI